MRYKTPEFPSMFSGFWIIRLSIGKTHTGMHLGEPSISGNVRRNLQSPCLTLFSHKFHTSDPFRNKIQILDILQWSIQKGNECQ